MHTESGCVCYRTSGKRITMCSSGGMMKVCRKCDFRIRFAYMFSWPNSFNEGGFSFPNCNREICGNSWKLGFFSIFLIGMLVFAIYVETSNPENVIMISPIFILCVPVVLILIFWLFIQLRAYQWTPRDAPRRYAPLSQGVMCRKEMECISSH